MSRTPSTRLADSPLARNIDAIVRSAGHTWKSASLAAGLGETYVREIATGRISKPSVDKLQALAGALRVPLAAILEAPDIPTPLKPATPAPRPPDLQAATSFATLPRDVPVYGTAAGSLTGAFQFEGGTIDLVRRPPALAGARDVYAIYVVGESMAPQHLDGDLRFVHPHRPIHVGDTVVVQTRNGEHQPPQAYIKNLVRRTADELLVRQLNPAAEISFRRQFVFAVHKVLTMNDLFGV